MSGSAPVSLWLYEKKNMNRDLRILISNTLSIALI